MARTRRTNCGCTSTAVTTVITTVVNTTVIAPVTVNTSVSINFPEKPYDYSIWAASTLIANETLFKTNVKRNLRLPSNFFGWAATLDIAATSTVVFPIFRKTSVTSQLGTVTFTPSATTGVFSSVSQTSISNGDQYIVKAPANVYGAQGLALTMLHTVRVIGTFYGNGSQQVVSTIPTSTLTSNFASINNQISIINTRLSLVSIIAELASGGGGGGAQSLIDAIASVDARVSNVSVSYTLDILSMETLINANTLAINQVSSQLFAYTPIVKLNAQANGSVINKRNVVVVSNTASGTYIVRMSVTQPSVGYYLHTFANSILRGAVADTKTSTTFRVRTFNTNTGALINTPFTVLMSR